MFFKDFLTQTPMSIATDFDTTYHRFLFFVKMMSYSPIGPAKEITRAVGRIRNYAEESVQRYWTQLRADPGKMLRVED